MNVAEEKQGAVLGPWEVTESTSDGRVLRVVRKSVRNGRRAKVCEVYCDAPGYFWFCKAVQKSRTGLRMGPVVNGKTLRLWERFAFGDPDSAKQACDRALQFAGFVLPEATPRPVET